MIIDTVSRLAQYESVLPGAQEAARLFLGGCAEKSPFEIRVKDYTTREDEKRRFEVHDHTVDLMIGISGREIIHVCPESRLTPAEALPSGADGRKLDGAPQGHAALLEENVFVALFPGEAHMVAGHPDGAPESVRKWVVKLPV